MQIFWILNAPSTRALDTGPALLLEFSSHVAAFTPLFALLSTPDPVFPSCAVSTPAATPYPTASYVPEIKQPPKVFLPFASCLPDLACEHACKLLILFGSNDLRLWDLRT